jgi:hypothetical protein
LIRDLVVDAFIAQDADFAVLGGDVNQNSVSEFGAVHAQLMKKGPGPVEGIASAMFLEVNPDFTGALEFGLLNAGA